MTKRIITICLILVLCLGVIPAQAMAAGTEVSRVEWIQTLVDVCSMEVEEEACPDNYFSDMSIEDEFYRDVIVAVEFGLIDTEPGLAFEPHAPATREFVAHTLNAALMFQLPEDTAYTYAESASVTYPDDIQVAINQGWFALSGGSFLPQQAMTQSEMTAITASVTQILGLSELEENHVNTYTYVDGVKDVNDADTVFFSADDELTIVGSAVELTEGDIFVVYMLDMPSAYEAQSVATDGDTMTVTVREMSMSDVVVTMDIQGESEVDLSDFIPAEGVEAIYVFEDGSETDSRTFAKVTNKKVKDVILKIKPKFSKIKVTGTLSFTDMNVQYKLAVLSEQYAMFRLDGRANLTVTAEADLLDLADIDDSIPIGVLDYGIGEAGVYAVFGLDGSCTLTVQGSFTAGVEFTDWAGMRSLTNFKREEFSVVTELNMKIGIQLKAEMNADLVKAHAYLEFGAKSRVKKVKTDERNCLDIVAYPYAEVDAYAHVDLYRWSDTQSKHYDILKEGDAPKIHYHYEDGILRQECRFGDMNFVNWIGGWNKFNLGGRINESSTGGSGNATYTLYEYELDDNYDAVITKYYGNARSLYVPKTIDGYDVVGIGWDAFNSNQYLISVHIPDSVETISNSAFYNCRNLEYVKLPEGLTEIEENAFAGCSSLRTLEIPDTVTAIEDGAFSGCSSLVSVKLSANLESLGGGVFRYCSSLPTITIPKSVRSGAWNIFSGCDSLKEVIFEDGMETIPAYILYGCESIEEITIPESVTKIGNNAFEECTNLKKVTMPDTLTRIDDSAFRYTGLTELDLPDSLTYIGECAFLSCTSLTAVEIPDSVTEIDAGAFERCTALESVKLPASLRSLGASAFRYCSSLPTITIPKSVQSGGWNIFSGCTLLKEVIFEDGMETIPSYILHGCKSIEEITIPDSVTKIGYNAFEECTNLKKVTMPDTLTRIDDSAFRYTGLTELDLPDSLTYIGECAFLSCKSLTAVEIPDSVTEIDTSAFESCTALESVKLPAGLRSLGGGAFRYCSSLTTVTIPKGTQSGGWNIFNGCTLLKEVIFEDGMETIPTYILHGCKSIEEITIPDSVTKIGYNAFEECTNLKKVTMPDTLTRIDDSAFRYTGLTELDLPDSLTYIGESAFLSCKSLTAVEIPDSVTEIDGSAFESCTALESVKFSANLKTIGWSAFNKCSALKTVELPDSLTELGYSCFHSCTSLESVRIPGSIRTIQGLTFYNCTSLKSVEIPNGITEIDAQAFSECNALETVTMANTVKEMGVRVFTGCSSLKNVTLSTGLTTIPSDAFKSCNALEEIVIPYHVTKIDSNAFNACSRLAKVVTHPKLTNINTSAFSYKNVTVFYGAAGSTTESWCATNGYRFVANTVAPTAVTLPENNISIAKGYTYTLTPGVAPLDAAYELTYKSTNTSVVTVDENGLIRAVGVGSTTVKVIAGDVYASVRVTVTQGVTNLSLNRNRLSLDVPNSETLIATVYPTDASNKTLSWSSSDETVATVDANGTVTAVGNGTATITATTTDGTNISRTCTVTVTDPNNIPVTGLTLNHTDLSREALDEFQLQATVSPENAANKNILWSSSDESVATVDANGKVRTLSKGVATITATAADGYGATATCTVRVTNNGIIVSELEQFQSSHPYTPNCTDFWLYTDKNASALRLTFAEDTCFEDECDFLDIFDGSGNLIGSFSGIELAGQTITITDSTVKVQLRTDGALNDWGFRVIDIVAVTCEHQYTEEVTDPGCTSEGYTTYTCTLCGHSYRDDFTDPAHLPVYLPAVAGTCLGEGKTGGSVCALCDIVLEPQISTGYGDHVYEVDHVNKPTCTEAGHTVYVCVLCNHTKNDQFVDPTGHFYESTVVPPNCVERGYTIYTCASCNHSYTDDYVEAGDHDYQLTDDTATCGQDGTKTFTCIGCGDSYTQSSPATGNHTYVTSERAPTCTEAGYTTYTCSGCHHSYQDDHVDPCGHLYYMTIVDPTCTEQGYTIYTCDNCDDSYVGNYVDATGHHYDNGTCTSCGDQKITVAAPSLKIAINASNGKPKLSWNKVEGATQYKVYRSTSKNGTYSRITTTTKTSVINTSAEAGKTYYYYVIAVDANGNESAKSKTLSATCDLAQPVITLSNVASTGKIKIRWSKIAGAVKYEVWRATSQNGTYTKLTTTTGTSVTNSKMDAGKTYYYKVKAIASKSTADSAFSDVASKMCDLAQPSIALSNVTSSGKIKVSWGKVTGAAKYEVWRATSKTGTYKRLTTTTKTSYTDTAATAGKTYYYKVRAVHSKADANSAYSSVGNLICDLQRPNLTVKLSNKGKPTLDWNDISGATKYKVYIYNSNGKLAQTVTVTSSKYVHSAAGKGKTYSYSVEALCKTAGATSAKTALVKIKSK